MAQGIPTTYTAKKGSWVRINGHEIPFPQYGVKQQLFTTVSTSRNAKNVVVGQRVGRDQYKLDSVVFPVLSAEDWSALLTLGKDYYVTVRFWAMDKNKWATTKMYVGDREAEVMRIDPETGRVLMWKNCAMNLIDVGSSITYSNS